MLLSLLLPLLRRKDTWYAAAIVLLLALSWGYRHRALDAELALSARPKIEDHSSAAESSKQTSSRRSAKRSGPVVIHKKTVKTGDGGSVTETTIERASTLSESEIVQAGETGKWEIVDHLEAPACPPAPRPPRWIIGASTSILEPGKALGVRAGVSLGGRVDLTIGYGFSGQDRLRVDLAYRF